MVGPQVLIPQICRDNWLLRRDVGQITFTYYNIRQRRSKCDVRNSKLKSKQGADTKMQQRKIFLKGGIFKNIM